MGTSKSQMVVTERLMAAMEAAAEISKEQMLNTVAQDSALAEECMALSQERNINSQERQINHIKALLEESGDFMEAQEKNDLSKNLYELCKSIQHTLSIVSGADGGCGHQERNEIVFL